MDWTNISLTEEQETALRSRAEAVGLSCDALITQIIGEALTAHPHPRPTRLDPAVGARALVCDISMADLFDD